MNKENYIGNNVNIDNEYNEIDKDKDTVDYNKLKEEYIMKINNGYKSDDEIAEDEEKEPKKPLKDEVISWIKTIAFCVIVALFINSFIIVNADIPTSSMENTIMTGDRIIANRLAYTFSEPERFDIIVFKFPDNPSKLYVKRVIGMPGETVELIDGEVYINDKCLAKEGYVKGNDTRDFGPYNVPEDHYFVLGDNREYSIDSRFWDNTYVPEDYVVAKPLFRYLPNFKLLVNE